MKTTFHVVRTAFGFTLKPVDAEAFEAELAKAEKNEEQLEVTLDVSAAEPKAAEPKPKAKK